MIVKPGSWQQKIKQIWVAIIKLLKRMMWPGVILLIVVVLIVFGILVPITGQTQTIELLKVVTWPAVVVSVVLIFRPSIKELINRATNVILDIPGGNKITISVPRAENLLNTMLQEIVRDMTPEESHEFIKFSDAPTQVSEEFERYSPYHDEILRPLRARTLIRPSVGGPWRKGEHIEITPFGRLVLQNLGENIKQKASQATTIPSIYKKTV